jgi:hypothetical protein
MRLTRPAAALVLTATCLTFVPSAAAQPRRPAPAPEAVTVTPRDATAVTATGASAEDTRRDLEEILKQYPPSLPRILRLDPSLLADTSYLQPYPALNGFLAQHPEVVHNPGYFFAGYDAGYGEPRGRVTPQERAVEMWRESIQGFTIGVVLLGIGCGVIWLIKTLIEHRRWSRLSKIQNDVHSKLLDRFTANEDLLAYIQTPAGRRFLESAPIPLESPRAINAPLGRILWSAQAGAVLTVLGIGILLVSRTTFEEVGAPLGAFGVVIIALGLGFIVSAFLAYTLTRRFGLLTDPNGPQESRG